MKVTVVTTMRNEAPHLLEWIAHHQAIGITNFLVFTNDCEDGTEALLQLLPGVTHIVLEGGKKPPQWRALRAAWDHPVVQDSDWLCCLDCDEFINLNSGLSDVPHLINSINADAIVLPWRLFGNDDHVNASNDLTIERFTKAAPEDMLYPAIGSYFKTLFRREGPFRQFGVHRPKQRNAQRHGLPTWANGSGQGVDAATAGNDGKIMYWGQPIARDLVQLNHYSVKSVAEFMAKRARGLPNHRDKAVDLTYWVERNFNTVEDTTIAPMIPATKARLHELMAISGVSDTLEKSRAWHRSQFADLMKDPQTLSIFGRLILAGSSQVPSQKRAKDLIRAYQIAHG